jgi:hypothetical protein
MVKVGDLVKRIAVLSVANDEYGWVLTDDFPDDVGIVLAVEEPLYRESEDGKEETEFGCFIKVFWQTRDFNGPVWHWSEEIEVIGG